MYEDKRIYEERVAVEMFFEKCLETKNMDYGEDRKAFIQKGIDMLETLVEKINSIAFEEGKKSEQKEIARKLETITGEYQEKMVIQNINSMKTEEE